MPEPLRRSPYFIASAANEKSKIRPTGMGSLILKASRPTSTISFIASGPKRPPDKI
jgi:hypothetical protein